MVGKNKANLVSLLVLSIFFSFFGQSVQYVRDESFHRFCKNVGSSPIKSDTNGDKCVVTWNFPAADLNEAEDYCKTWAVHPLVKSELVGDRPKCTYINAQECRSDYTLIKGYCYRMVRKDMRTYDEAIEDCKTQQIKTPHVTAQLITIFNNEQLRFIRAFFADLRGFWTKRRNSAERNFAVVFGIAEFYRGAAQGDEIELRKNDRAQVMCVYQAQETPLSFAAKARMLAPYYLPILLNGYDTAWRSANQYSAMISGNIQEVYEVCEKSMRAIVGSDVGTYRDPTIVNQASLTSQMKNSFNMLYFPMFHCHYITYTRYDYYDRYKVFTLKKGESSIPNCENLVGLDRSKYSSADGYIYNDVRGTLIYTVAVFPEKVDGHDLWERKQAYRAPIMCTVDYTPPVRPTKCSNGWTMFKRESGRVVCHKLYNTIKVSYEEARKKCKADGARLSIFTTLDEFNTLKALGGTPMTSRYIGLRKKDICPRITYGKCGLLAIVEFVDDDIGENIEDVRRVIEAEWPRRADGTFKEPNNFKNDELCIEIRDNLKLNDTPCRNRLHFTCMKDADVF